MPHGLNKKRAKGIDTIIQFHLTGEEPTHGYLTIKDLKCTYAERRKKVEQVCYNAGEQVVKEGKINGEFMEAVSDVEITQKKFQEQAGYFWESLDGKASYLKSSFILEYTNDT